MAKILWNSLTLPAWVDVTEWLVGSEERSWIYRNKGFGSDANCPATLNKQD
jgi:hypothetical protein